MHMTLASDRFVKIKHLSLFYLILCVQDRTVHKDQDIATEQYTIL